MNKPVYLLPFIFVYRAVLFISKCIIFVPRYSAIGIFFSLFTFATLVVNIIFSILKYPLYGFLYFCFIMYKIITLSFLKNKKKIVIVNKHNVDIAIKNEKIKESLEVNNKLLNVNSKPKKKSKILGLIFKIIIFLPKYSAIGFFFATFSFITILANIIVVLITYEFKGLIFSCVITYKVLHIILLSKPVKYILTGWVIICFLIYRLLRYVFLGLSVPLVLAFRLIAVEIHKSNKKNHESFSSINRKKAAQRLAEVERKKEDEARKKAEAIQKKKEIKEKNEYINESLILLERKTLGEKINDFLEKIIHGPKGVKKTLREKYENLAFVKNKKNQEAIAKEALLINFDSADAVKSGVKLFYDYVAKDKNGKIEKGIFEAYSKVEVHSYLLSEGLEVYMIKLSKYAKLFYGGSNAVKIKIKDLVFFLTQLSTYIKAGIPLVEALKILSRQFSQPKYKRIFKSMIYDLTMGENFSSAMEKQGVAFPRLLVNMVKAAEMTGELPESLDNMVDYFTEVDKTKKQMVTALIYPTIVLTMSLIVVTFIIIYVVPNFVEIYESMDAAKIPAITLFIIALSDFLGKYMILILIIICLFLAMLIYLFKNVRLIRIFMQYMAMKFPVMGNIIIYNEVTIFTKTFSSLLSHNVFITDSMEVLNKITNNEIYKMIIIDTINNLAKGDKISTSFANHWAFPMPAYEMLVTGEKTGQLPEMMEKVSSYYQEMHRNSVTRLKSLLEPILIVFLTFVVGGIILAVIVPMFGMFSQLN